MPMVSLKLMAGAARSMVVASARTTGAAEIAARSGVHMCARKSRGRCGHVQGEDRERPSGSNHGWSACVPAPPGVFDSELEMSNVKCASAFATTSRNLTFPQPPPSVIVMLCHRRRPALVSPACDQPRPQLACRRSRMHLLQPT
jgi:hypothetical protein